MKKVSLVAFLAMFLGFAQGAFAFDLTSRGGDFFKIQAGGGYFGSKASGKVRYNGTQKFDVEDDFGLDDKSNDFYVWAMVKHPFPIIPNVRVESVKYSSDGKAQKTVTWGGNTYTASAKTEFELRQTDLIAYYNILNSFFWVTLDAGIDARIFRGKFVVGDKKASADFVLPLGFARARVDIPGTGLGIEANVKYVSYDHSSIKDMSIKADYLFGLGVFDVGVEAGYKMQNFSLDTDLVDVSGDMDIDGVFVGFVVKF